MASDMRIDQVVKPLQLSYAIGPCPSSKWGQNPTVLPSPDLRSSLLLDNSGLGEKLEILCLSSVIDKNASLMWM